MKKIGILGAMILEVDQLIDAMTIVNKKSSAGSTYYIGQLSGKDVVVACCGVGKVNAASSAQIMISEYGVDAIINTGIAGGMHKDVHVCDIVVSNEVTHHDVRKDQMIRCYPCVESFRASDELITTVVKALKAHPLEEGRYHIGKIVSGESFISSKVEKDKIIQAYQPYCVEMEGAAIGHVAHINKIPFLVLRSISDHADDQADMTYKTFEDIAAKQSSRLIMKMLEFL